MSVPSSKALIDRAHGPAATFATRWLTPSMAVISACGEIDAANARDFTEYALRHTAHADRFVLDLTGVDFFGAVGLSTLKAIGVRCSVGDVDCVLVPSKAVSRLLRICDPESTPRSCPTVAAALSTLRGKSPLLQLVTKPG
ncbi:STAS domain-containing protein [Mycolicibacterium sp. XJ870]